MIDKKEVSGGRGVFPMVTHTLTPGHLREILCIYKEHQPAALALILSEFAEPQPTYDNGYMVSVNGGAAPFVVHGVLGGAETEAERLAKKHPNTLVRILGLKATYKYAVTAQAELIKS